MFHVKHFGGRGQGGEDFRLNFQRQEAKEPRNKRGFLVFFWLPGLLLAPWRSILGLEKPRIMFHVKHFDEPSRVNLDIIDCQPEIKPDPKDVFGLSTTIWETKA
jgi:hypothetical protein